MPTTPLTPQVVQADDLEYVGFWLRWAASMLDSLLQGVITLAVGVLLWFSGFYPTLVTAGGWSSLSMLIIKIFLPILIVLAFWYFYGATPGKMAVGAKIVDSSTGEKPSLGQFLIRYLSYFLSGVIFGLGFFWIAFDPRKQGWHDKLAGTVVVRSKNRRTRTVRFEQ